MIINNPFHSTIHFSDSQPQNIYILKAKLTSRTSLKIQALLVITICFNHSRENALKAKRKAKGGEWVKQNYASSFMFHSLSHPLLISLSFLPALSICYYFDFFRSKFMQYFIINLIFFSYFSFFFFFAQFNSSFTNLKID